MKLVRISLLAGLLLAVILVFRAPLAELLLEHLGQRFSFAIQSSITDLDLNSTQASFVLLPTYGITLTKAKLDYNFWSNKATPYSLTTDTFEYLHGGVNFTCKNCELSLERQNFKPNPFSLNQASLNIPESKLKVSKDFNITYQGQVNGLVTLNQVDLKFSGNSKELGELTGSYRKTADTHFFNIKNQPSINLITDVNFVGQFSNAPSGQVVIIDKLTAKFLDAKVTTEPFNYSLNKKKCSTFRIKIAELSVAKLLELYKQEQIEAEGTISGTVPLQFCQNTWSVKEGVFSSDKGGQVKIALPESGQNATTDFAFQALRHFEYSKLIAKMSILGNGDMQIALTLHGTPMAMNKKTPIVVNLNVADNLYALLRSLNISKEIVKRIEEQYRSK